MEHELTMKATGIARNAHERFPITFNVSDSGTSYFNGCKIEAEIENNGNKFTKRIDVRAFRELADELAVVQDGDLISIRGNYDMQKGKDDKYYPVLTVTEVLSV